MRFVRRQLCVHFRAENGTHLPSYRRVRDEKNTTHLMEKNVIEAWINDYEKVSRNALSFEWFVSPLEYHWGNGKALADKIFQAVGSPSSGFDEMVSPPLYQMAMNADFRAKMMVFAFMRQDVAKSFGVEIESGLISLYRLDFLPCLSQWIFVVEGYCRKLFGVASLMNVKPSGWTLPTSGDTTLDRLITCISEALAQYLDGILFKSVTDFHIERLSRHLLLHGNVGNKNFFSQKNCLILMFILDALVTIEMVKNRAFPAVFKQLSGEADRIKQRTELYLMQIRHAFQDENLFKIQVLKQHI